MERYGIQVNNRAGNVVLHSDFSTYVFKGKLYANSTARVVTQGSGFKAYDSSILDVGYTSSYTLIGPLSELDDLIPFVKPNPLFSMYVQRVAPKVFKKEVVGSTVTYTFGITHDYGLDPPIIYYFVPRRNLPDNNLDYGLEVYDEQGNINFSTDYKPLRVDGVVKVTPPSGQIHDTVGGSVSVRPKFGKVINTPYSNHGGDILYSWDSVAFGAGRETKTWRETLSRKKHRIFRQKKHIDHLLTAYSGFRSCISAYGNQRTRISYIGDFGGIYQTSKDHGWEYTGFLGGVLNAMSDIVEAIKTIVHTVNVIGALQALILGAIGEGSIKPPAITLPARSTTENMLMYSRASYYD